jgi:polyribonucleotide nucleotidyltransferase
VTPVQTVIFEDRNYDFELGICADRATGSALVRSDSVHVLAIVDTRPPTDSTGFQLSTDFRLRASAIGRIPSNFLKRETRPSDAEILMSRLIDRSIRPQFPTKNEHKTVISVMLLGGLPDSDILKTVLFAVSLALRNAGVHIPIVLGETYRQGDQISLSFAVQADGLVMAEAGLKEVQQSTVTETLIRRVEALSGWCKSINTLVPISAPVSAAEQRPTIALDFDAIWQCDDINERRRMRSVLAEQLGQREGAIDESWTNHVKTQAQNGQRQDGRDVDAIRPIKIRSQMSPTAHGAVQFSRGGTTALVFATLGSSRELQDVPNLFYGLNRERLIVHYCFHPFATNQAELGRHMPNRREVGHGHLIKRALAPLIPDKEDFPFAIRINSEIMSADGSSSMASVMGASLALAEAGIPIPRPVAGVSVGLFETDNQPILFTDLTEDEDHASIFDLKVTGTTAGLTALQLDIKASHLDSSVIAEAMVTAQNGIDSLINQITPAWTKNRTQNLHLSTPSTTFKVNRADVGRVIGSGGKNLKALQQATQCRIELSKRGTVAVSARCRSALRRTVHRVSTLSMVFEPGRLYLAQPGSVQTSGMNITVNGKFGLIIDAKSEWTQCDVLLVRFLKKREDGKLEFEGVKDDTLSFEQAMNAPVKN